MSWLLNLLLILFAIFIANSHEMVVRRYRRSIADQRKQCRSDEYVRKKTVEINTAMRKIKFSSVNGMMEYGDNKIDFNKVIAHAPTTISTLVHLLMAARNWEGVELQNPPNAKYQFAMLTAGLETLQQKIYNAFENAHTQMDNLGQIAESNKPVFRMILNAFDEVMNDAKELEIETNLNLLSSNIQECIALAETMEKELEEVTDFIDALISAVKHTKSISQRDLNIVTFNISNTKLQIDQSEIGLSKLESWLNETKEKLDKAEGQYDEMVKERPGIGAYIGLAFVDMVTSSVKSLVKGVTKFGDTTGSLYRKAADKKGEGAVGKTLTQIMTFKAFVAEANDNRDKYNEAATGLHNDDHEQAYIVAKDMLVMWRQQKTRFTQESNEIDDPIKDKYKTFIEKSITYYNGIMSYEDTNATVPDKEMADIDKQASQLSQETVDMKMSVDKLTETENAKVITPPEAQTTQQGDTDSIAANYVNGYQQNLRNARENFDVARNNYKSQKSEWFVNFQTHSGLVVKLDQLNFTQFELKKTIAILGIALSELQQVRKSWLNVKQFFKKIGTMIKFNYAKKASNLDKMLRAKLKTKNLKLNSVILYKQALESYQMSQFINKISSQYVKFSSLHILPTMTNIHDFEKVDESTVKKYNQISLAAHDALKKMFQEDVDAMNKEYEDLDKELQKIDNDDACRDLDKIPAEKGIETANANIKPETPNEFRNNPAKGNPEPTGGISTGLDGIP